MSLKHFVLYWNSVHILASSLANFCAFGFFLHKWRTFGREATVRASYLVYFFVLAANLANLCLTKLPTVHSQWDSKNRFLFGYQVCKTVVVLSPALQIIPTNSLAFLQTAIWTRQRKVAKRIHLDEKFEWRRGLLVIMCSTLLSMTVGLCLAHHPVVGSSGTMPGVTLYHYNSSHNQCRAQNNISTLWTLNFKWTFGFLGPLCLLAIPFGLHLCKYYLTSTSQLLKNYVCLNWALIGTNFMLHIPSLIRDIAHLMPMERLRFYDPLPENFVIHILTVLVPDLQLLYIPLGMFIVLPHDCEDRPRRKKKKRIETFDNCTITTSYQEGQDEVERKPNKEEGETASHTSDNSEDSSGVHYVRTLKAEAMKPDTTVVVKLGEEEHGSSSKNPFRLFHCGRKPRSGKKNSPIKEEEATGGKQEEETEFVLTPDFSERLLKSPSTNV